MQVKKIMHTNESMFKRKPDIMNVAFRYMAKAQTKTQAMIVV